MTTNTSRHKPITEVHPNQYCCECAGYYYGEPAQCPDPKCKDAKTIELEKQPWWPAYRQARHTLQQQYYTRYLTKITELHVRRAVMEDIYEEVFPKEFQDAWPDEADALLAWFECQMFEIMRVRLDQLFRSSFIPLPPDELELLESENDCRAQTECPDACEVEMDGICPHGYESRLVLFGLI